MQPELDLPALVGQLVVGGFEGERISPRFAEALSSRRRGGAILFKRNLPSIAVAGEMCRAIVDASPPGLPPFIAVDQEGGRVTRLPSPFTVLPPMRALASIGDDGLVRRAATIVARELSAIGFNLNFAPVLDVDTNPRNPIIGDRAFGADAAAVSRFAVAFLEAQQAAGVLACGKHFPGHGDTDLDSHLALPSIHHDRARLDAVELPPFRAAAAANVATLMSAHIVCEALDPGVPATLSPKICTDLLRRELGFRGVLFSDDLEMKAIAARWPMEEAGVLAIRAGCDALLVCKDEDAQDRVYDELLRTAERDAGFRARCAEAAGRVLEARRRCPPRPAPAGDLSKLVGADEGRALLAEIAARRASVR